MAARIKKTLIPEQGYAHREHRSKRTRSPRYYQERDYRITKSLWTLQKSPFATTRLSPTSAMASSSAIRATTSARLPTRLRPLVKILPRRNPALARMMARNRRLREQMLLQRDLRKIRQAKRLRLTQEMPLPLMLPQGTHQPRVQATVARRKPLPVADRRLVGFKPPHRYMEHEATAKLIDCATDAYDAVRARLAAGHYMHKEDAELISRTSYMAGFVE